MVDIVEDVEVELSFFRLPVIYGNPSVFPNLDEAAYISKSIHASETTVLQ